MEKQTNPKASNFWSGFILGGMTLGGLVFAFGTKKGRKMMKQALEMSEDWEKNLSEIINSLSDEVKNELPQGLKTLEKNVAKIEKKSPTINLIMEKMKTLSPLPEKKATKKFFTKDKKTT
jgi:hypothetical protein